MNLTLLHTLGVKLPSIAKTIISGRSIEQGIDIYIL